MAIYCLIGHSASGKSSIERSLTEEGYDRIISHTTRPMRYKEENGVDYFYVSEEEFADLKNTGFFSETAQYREWNYGMSLSGVDYENKDYIAVVTVHGYAELLKEVGKENIVSIFVTADERLRMHRLLDRGDDIDEIMRRIKNDRIDFQGIEDICDYVVDNNSYTIEEIKLQVISVISGNIKHF